MDAVNATVTEMKEKYIFQATIVPKAEMRRIAVSTIRVPSSVPTGYERMAVIAYVTGITFRVAPDLANPLFKTSDYIDLYIQTLDVNAANTVWEKVLGFYIFTIFVKRMIT